MPARIEIDTDAAAARYDDGDTLTEIAADLGVSRMTLTKRLREAGHDVGHGPQDPALTDPEWLASHVADGWTIRRIADDRGVTFGAVRRALLRYDIDLPDGRTSHTDPRLDDPEWLRDRVEAQWTISGIAREVGVDRATVRSRLDTFDLPIPSTRAPRSDPRLGQREWMAARVADGWQAFQIAAETGVQVRTVLNWGRRHGLHIPNEDPRLHDREWLSEQLDSGATATSIADDVNAAPARVIEQMAALGIR